MTPSRKPSNKRGIGANTPDTAAAVGPPIDAEPLILDPLDPIPSARKFVAARYANPLGRTLHRYGGSFYVYTGTHYREQEAEALRADLYQFLTPAMRWVRDQEKREPVLAPFKPTMTKVSHVVDALMALAYLDQNFAMPGWLDGNTTLPSNELVPLANGLLHLPTGRLVPHTPQFFGNFALPFSYNSEAAEPTGWLSFLDSIWPSDAEARDTLQELMGLLLTPETRYQKIFLIVGPKRSGKGTIARVIRAMLGAGNVAGPTLSSLASNFGLQPLLGKPAAIISDARLGNRADAATIAERLLSISGEDAISVDRKFTAPWTGTLPTRVLILTNELPRIADASGALASRFVVLTMSRSFYGEEDQGLTDRLITELPAIFNWATVGWHRLAKRRHFLMPTSSAEAVRDIEALSSPILAFLNTACEVRPGASVKCRELFDRWCSWCKAQGREHPGTTQTFGRDLKAAVAGLSVKRPHDAEGRERHYEGVCLRSAGPRWSADSILYAGVEGGSEGERYNAADRGPSRTVSCDRAFLCSTCDAQVPELGPGGICGNCFWDRQP